jgi:hypothetical protein
LGEERRHQRWSEPLSTNSQRRLLPIVPVPGGPIRLHDGATPDVRSVFERAGLTPCATPDAPRVVPFSMLPELPDDGSLTVGLFDGKLGALQAECLKLPCPPLLLACRNGGAPTDWETRAVAVALGQASLTAACPVASYGWRVGQVADLHGIANEAQSLAQEAGCGTAAATAVADVMYELAANALFDAPAGRDGQPKYAHRRGQHFEIDREDTCRASMAVADGRAYLTATDLFGRLTAEPLARVVAGLGAKAQINRSGGGAGLGFRRIIEFSDLCAVRVQPGVVSEVLCVVDLVDTRLRSARPKSLFFVSQGSS